MGNIVDDMRDEDVKDAYTRGLAEGRKRAIGDVTQWMREHMSGISAPNERDFAEMREWLKERQKRSR